MVFVISKEFILDFEAMLIDRIKTEQSVIIFQFLKCDFVVFIECIEVLKVFLCAFMNSYLFCRQNVFVTSLFDETKPLNYVCVVVNNFLLLAV
jgi:hypothetical protein